MVETPDHKACKKHIIKCLLKRLTGMTGDSINVAIKEYRLFIVLESLDLLLSEGVIAISNKRFWIRNRPLALSIANEGAAQLIAKEPGKERWFNKAVEIVETGKVPEGVEVRRKA